MADSKTARASAVKVLKEIHVETIDEAIKAIRDNRAASLFIGDMSRVDKLLQAYDAALVSIVALNQGAAAQAEKLQAQEKAYVEHTEQLAASAKQIEGLFQQVKDRDAEVSLLTKALAKYQIEEEDSDENFEENMAACEAAIEAPSSVVMKDPDCIHGDQT